MADLLMREAVPGPPPSEDPCSFTADEEKYFAAEAVRKTSGKRPKLSVLLDPRRRPEGVFSVDSPGLIKKRFYIDLEAPTGKKKRFEWVPHDKRHVWFLAGALRGADQLGSLPETRRPTDRDLCNYVALRPWIGTSRIATTQWCHEALTEIAFHWAVAEYMRLVVSVREGDDWGLAAAAEVVDRAGAGAKPMGVSKLRCAAASLHVDSSADDAALEIAAHVYALHAAGALPAPPRARSHPNSRSLPETDIDGVPFKALVTAFDVEWV